MSWLGTQAFSHVKWGYRGYISVYIGCRVQALVKLRVQALGFRV